MAHGNRNHCWMMMLMDGKFTIGTTMIYAPLHSNPRRAQYVGKEAVIVRHPHSDTHEVYIVFASGLVLLVPEYDLRPVGLEPTPGQAAAAYAPKTPPSRQTLYRVA